MIGVRPRIDRLRRRAANQCLRRYGQLADILGRHLVAPDLHKALQEYAALYASAYGREEPVAELVPAMLTAFLEGDRAFARSRSISK